MSCRKHHVRLSVGALTLLLACSLGQANPIFFEVENLGADRWEYSYTLANETAAPIDEFTIWFELGLYDNLSITGSPGLGWDGFAAQPDPLLPDDGFADWLALGLPIDVGSSLAGFSVAFDFLGAGDPGSQFFEIVDPLDFTVLSDGFTQPLPVDPPVATPEPSTLALIAIGLIALGRCRSPRCSSRVGAAKLTAALASLPLWMLAVPMSHAGVESLSVDSQNLTGRQRAGRAHFDYTYTIDVRNGGEPLTGVIATVVSQSPNTQIIDGTVELGALETGTVTSTATFTMRQNRRVPFNPNDLQWTFVADEPPPPGDSAPELTTLPPLGGSVGIGYRYDADAVDADVDDVLRFSLAQAPAGMEIDPTTGVLSWAPAQSGAYDVDLRVTDRTGLSDRQLFLIQVNAGPTDRSPSLAAIGPQVTVAGTRLTVLASATDPEGEALRFAVESAPAGLVINTTTGVVQWTPSAAQVGSAPVTISVSDPGGQRAVTSFTVTVLEEAMNNAPQLSAVADQRINAQQTLALQFSASDEDPNETLRFDLQPLPAGAQLDAISGTFRWTPGADLAGTASYALRVTDSAGDSASTQFSIAVLAPALPPVAADDAYTVSARGTLTVSAPGVLANDRDGNNDVLSATQTSDPDLGTVVSFPGDGSFSYEPPPIPPLEIGLREQCTSTERPGAAHSALAVADIDLDGDIEMVLMQAVGITNVLAIYNAADCSLQASVPFPPGAGQTTAFSTVTLVNLDDDPELEIVGNYSRFNSAVLPADVSKPFFYALNIDGTPVWDNAGGLTAPTSFTSILNSGQRVASAVPVDLNGDGVAELVHGTTNVSVPGLPQNVTGSSVTAYDGRTGEVLWEHIGESTTGISVPLNVTPVDLDLDGTPELIWHTSVLNADGSLRFTLPTEFDPIFRTRTFLDRAVGNFDLDPYPEIIAYDRSNHYLFEHTGALTWQRPRPSFNRSAVTALTLVQLDEDGAPEYVVASSLLNDTPNSGQFGYTAFDTNGDLLWRHQDRGWGSGVSAQRFSAPVAFDLDRDGIDELIGSHPGAGSLQSGIHVFSGFDGDVIASYPSSLQNDIQAPLTVADLDGDGAAEIITTPNESFGLDERIIVLEGLLGNPFPDARAIRNHGNYQATAVSIDGSLPTEFQPHWLIPGFNKVNYAAVLPGDQAPTVTTFSYEASDGSASDSADVAVTIGVVNAPTIVSAPLTGGSPGFAYRYGALATDADVGETLQWTLVEAPEGMRVDSFGIVEWLPTQADLGTAAVSLVVTDSDGNSDVQSFAVNVQPPVPVPDLIGSGDPEAMQALADANLASGNVSESFSLTVPAGAVISQSVVGGATSPAGAPIDYVISLGPPPIFVPNVIGLPQAIAEATIEDLTLAVGTIAFANSDTVPRGAVVSQSVTAFQELPSGSTVSLVISGGPALLADLSVELIAPGDAVQLNLAAFDPSGAPLALPADLTLTVVPDSDTLGPEPTVAGTQLQTAVTSSGGYSLLIESASLAVQQTLPFAVSELYATDGLQAGYAAVAVALDRLIDAYAALETALGDGNLLAVPALTQDLANARAAIDLEDLALTPATGLTTGFLPATAPDFPVSADFATPGLLDRAQGALTNSQLFLERLDQAAGRNDDLRALTLNDQLSDALTALATAPLTRRSTVVHSAALQQILSIAVPRLVVQNVDSVLGALGDAGLLGSTTDAADFYAQQRSAAPMSAGSLPARPVFFSLPSLMTASQIRMKVVKEFYFPIVKQVVKNLQNLAANGLIQTFFETAPIPGIVTGASLSFHSFELQGSIVEAFSGAENGDGNIVYLVGPTLIAEIASALDGVRGVRFNNMKEIKKSVLAIRDAAKGAAAALQDQFKQAIPDETLNGCVFTGVPGCRQLGFGDGLPVVHKAGNFPAPVLLLVYDAVTGQVSLGNFLFFPKSG